MRDGARVGVLTGLMGLAAISFAQTPGESEKRGNTPPGISRDGAGPAEGALMGGSIGRTRSLARDIERCNELGGRMRRDCLCSLGTTGSDFFEPMRFERPLDSPANSVEIDATVTVARAHHGEDRGA